jgi:hypothetical protein
MTKMRRGPRIDPALSRDPAGITMRETTRSDPAYRSFLSSRGRDSFSSGSGTVHDCDGNPPLGPRVAPLISISSRRSVVSPAFWIMCRTGAAYRQEPSIISALSGGSLPTTDCIVPPESTYTNLGTKCSCSPESSPGAIGVQGNANRSVVEEDVAARARRRR